MGPLIDVAALRRDPSSGEAAHAIATMDAACVETGFFVVTGHGLDDEMTSVFDASRAFFGLDQDAKDESAMVGIDGYLALGAPRSGPKEMFDVGLGGFDRWPDLDGFRDTITRYQLRALGVAADILAGLTVALSVEPTFFADRMRDPQCVLRLIRYPSPATTADITPTLQRSQATQATGAHTDYGAITLLATDGVPGLEVRAIGKDWTALEAPAGSIVVNLGDMLARWTNRRYVSTPHRVVPMTAAPRYSVPFFVNPDPDTLVTCIPSCVDHACPCRYEPITAGAFLQGRIDGTIPTGDGEHA